MSQDNPASPPSDICNMQTAYKTHELKCWPEFYRHLESGEKTFEARKDDRGFRAGDVLWLREWSKNGGYTGREMRRTVTYLLSGLPWLQQNYVVMALSASPPSGPTPLVDELDNNVIRGGPYSTRERTIFMLARTLERRCQAYEQACRAAKEKLSHWKARCELIGQSAPETEKIIAQIDAALTGKE